VKTAAGGAIDSIQNGLALWNAVQNLWYGLSLGSVLLLAAIGLAITFGVYRCSWPCIPCMCDLECESV
jgi:urea transport system permease protein